MPRGGARAGAGRKKGGKEAETLRKLALLASVPEQFKNADYDPLKEMISLAKKQRPDSVDGLRFSFHLALAKKYYPDVSAMKISGDEQNPLMIARALSPEQRQARLDELWAKTNGHEVEAGAYATDC